MRSSPAILLLAALVVGALTSLIHTASDAPVSNGDFYPQDAVRVYDVPRSCLLEVVREILERHRFEIRSRDELAGILIMGRRAIRDSAPPSLKPFESIGEYRLEDIEMHVYAPRSIGPSRLHLGTVLEARHRDHRDGRTLFSTGHLERWLHARVAERLESTGFPLPLLTSARRRFLQEWWPAIAEDACLKTLHAVQPDDPGVTGPSVFLKSKVQPSYPGSAVRAEEADVVVLRFLIDEAGVVGLMRLEDETSPRTEFEISAAQTVALWRFRPARDEAGCAVPCWWKVRIDFKMR